MLERFVVADWNFVVENIYMLYFTVGARLVDQFHCREVSMPNILIFACRVDLNVLIYVCSMSARISTVQSKSPHT